jgi:predicted aspartyl protease
MGKIVVKLKLANYVEEQMKKLKLFKGEPCSVETEALVDSGATRLYLQSRVIRALGLRKEGEIISRTTNGRRTRGVYQAARLDLMGRDGNFDVVKVDDDVPNLLGQIPPEYLDFVVDPKGQRLIPNPEHGGIQMTEEY